MTLQYAAQPRGINRSFVRQHRQPLTVLGPVRLHHDREQMLEAQHPGDASAARPR